MILIWKIISKFKGLTFQWDFYGHLWFLLVTVEFQVLCEKLMMMVMLKMMVEVVVVITQ